MVILTGSKDSFISFFPIYILLIYFSCLIVLAKISAMMLIRSGESGHPHLIHKL